MLDIFHLILTKIMCFLRLGAPLNVVKPMKGSSVAVFGLGAVDLLMLKPVQEMIAERTNGGVDRIVECTGHIDAMIFAFEGGRGVAVLWVFHIKNVVFPLNLLNERTLKVLTFFVTTFSYAP
ncbi:putative alcohol dehydrogenase [Helianthus annuus]|nr:putative alcohol dehydrogenase [Helianthus annuus]KAJ0697532.1 putative alcohol dehydrogenase [Helianthus annuus]KAJ0700865.1 putative alcohol dehydrogenase [Helianthus annuus]